MRSLITLFSLTLSINTCVAWSFGTIEASAVQPPSVQIVYGEYTANCTIAKFKITANGDPFGDSLGFELTQMAFDVSATGSWIYHQVFNVRLVDEQGNIVSGMEKVFSDPIVCDCDSGRVIFDTVTNFTVYTGIPREISLVADISGPFPTNSYITVSYKQGDSRIVDLPSLVNATLTPITQDLKMRLTVAVAVETKYPVRIDRILYSNLEHTNLTILSMFGTIEPNTLYKVDVSTNLSSWVECGQITPIDYHILNEPAVAVIDRDIYKDKAFFRLRKAQ